MKPLIDIIDTTNEPNIIEQLMTNKPKTTHGGRRANAGRKPSPYTLKVRNIKVPEHWPWNKGIRAKIRELMQSEAGGGNVSVLYDVADFQHQSPIELPKLNLK